MVSTPLKPWPRDLLASWCVAFVVSYQICCLVRFFLPPFFGQNFQILGNGSCRMHPTNWQPTDSSTGKFTKEESADFFHRLNLHFVSYLVYPRVFTTNPNITLKIGQVPPVMDPKVSGDVVLDTEFEVSLITIHLSPSSFCIHNLQKNSHILKNKNLLYGSQQSLMRCLKSGKLKISELGEYSDAKMTKLCEELDFTSMSR